MGMRFLAWVVSLCVGTSSLSASTCALPDSVLFQAGLDAVFVAKFALFTALLVFGTLLFGKIFKNILNIPVVAGQIIGGIILGPTLLNIQRWSFFCSPMVLTDTVTQQSFSLIPSDLFLFFILLLGSAFTVSYLLWLAGFETNIEELMRVGGTAVSAGILGALLPIIMIGGFLYMLSYSALASIGIGIVFAATSVSIPVAMLVGMNKMHLKSSQATLGAAIVDDIFAIILLSLFLMFVVRGALGSVPGVVAGHGGSLSGAIGSMIVCAVVMYLIGHYVLPKFMEFLKASGMKHLLIPISSGVMLMYFAFAELVGGLAGITGAYFAGLFHRKSDPDHIVERVVSPFVNSLMLPMFLGSIGLQVDLSVLSAGQWVLVCIILFLSVVSKLLACAVSAGTANMSAKNKERWSMLEIYVFGSSMVARGEVGLVVATILKGSGIIDSQSYVLSIVVIVLTTIATPIMLSIGFSKMEAGLAEQEGGHFEFTMGRFRTVGTHHMFNIIAGCLEAHEHLSSSIRFSEGRKIVHLDGHNVKILYSETDGIVFEGDRKKISEIIAFVKEDVLADIQKISPV